MLLCYHMFFSLSCLTSIFFFFFFNDTATTEIYTLSLHDALPIYGRRREDPHPHRRRHRRHAGQPRQAHRLRAGHGGRRDRKSTRLNSSHLVISYAVLCLKKKTKTHTTDPTTPRTAATAPEIHTNT